jgi:hypothetical protein
MLNYNTLSLGFLSSATLLFFALGLNSELSQVHEVEFLNFKMISS